MVGEERLRNLKMHSQATSLYTEILSSVIKQHNTSELGQAHDSRQPSLQSATAHRSSARPGSRSPFTHEHILFPLNTTSHIKKRNSAWLWAVPQGHQEK